MGTFMGYFEAILAGDSLGFKIAKIVAACDFFALLRSQAGSQKKSAAARKKTRAKKAKAPSAKEKARISNFSSLAAPHRQPISNAQSRSAGKSKDFGCVC
jgi:hypothetical protein